MKKSEQGSVTLIVLVTVLFIIAILSAYLTFIISKRKAQLAETKQLQQAYDGDLETAYTEQEEKRKMIKDNKYTALEYIECNGSQYIDTGVKADQSTEIKMTVEFTSLQNNSALSCSRNRYQNNSYTLFAVSSEQKFRFDYNTGMDTLNTTLATNTKYNIYANRNKIYLNGELKSTETEANFSANGNIYLMASYQTPYTNIDNYGKYKLYSVQILKDDEIIRDFVPAYMNEKVGLYDKANNIFYQSKGTDLIKSE